jgi:hypothetical protein
MTIDITPEAVKHLCAIHDGYEQHGTVATLRALSAALTAAQSETASAYVVAADMIESECDDDMTRAEEAAMIRALTPADSKAALARMLADAEERGMRKSLDAIAELATPMTEDCMEGHEQAYRAIESILAAIPKGTPP